MPSLTSLFREREPSSFPGVLIPLKSIRRRPDGDAGPGTGADDHVGNDEDEALLTSDAVEDVKEDFEKELGLADTDTAYERKSKIINKAISDIGMGKYQWELFILCGMGWLADNLWMQGLALTLPQLSTEFGVSSSTVRYTTMFTFLGLSVGSTFWGVASDIIGRRPAFNATLLICGAFGMSIAFGPTWIVTSLLYAGMGVGVGGNLPVDGALFLEFLPFASSSLLTLLSVWWPVGQLIAAIMGWALIPPFSCDEGLSPCSMVEDGAPCCTFSKNLGWRYFNFAMGVFTIGMFICRFFLFQLFESPKFYLSCGKQAQAVNVVHGVAHYNKGKTWLTEDILDDIGNTPDDERNPQMGLSIGMSELNRQRIGKFSMDKVAALFATRQLGLTTALLWLSWFCIGLAYPLFNAFLPQYLEHAGQGEDLVPSSVVYRNFVITSIAGVPGSIIAYYLVDHPRLGRRGTMAISTILSGCFVFLFTLSPAPNYQLFCSAVANLVQNASYAILYAMTPEAFPAPVRGTGTGIGSLLNRLAGLSAPVIAATAGTGNSPIPIVLAAGMYVMAGVAMFALPIETRGMQSL